jgi:hypothetical protein
MTRIFVLGSLEDQEPIYIENDADRAVMMNLDGTPQGSAWRPPKCRLLGTADRKRQKHSDMPFYVGGVPILREAAKAALEPLLARDGEILPIDCQQSQLWLFNCTRVIDALDEKLSRVMRFDSGRIWRIDEYAFLPARAGDANAFRIPQLRVSDVFFSESVVEAAMKASLVRAPFRLVWEG